MADVFVSYSQRDRDRVTEIVQAIEGSGWSVWWDERGADGATLNEKVMNEINAAKCVVVVWSKASIRSDWVLGEADEGRKRRILVAVTIDGEEPPLQFRQVRVASLKDWRGGSSNRGLRSLFDDVRTLVETKSGGVVSGLQIRSPQNSSRLGNVTLLSLTAGVTQIPLEKLRDDDYDFYAGPVNKILLGRTLVLRCSWADVGNVTVSDPDRARDLAKSPSPGVPLYRLDTPPTELPAQSGLNQHYMLSQASDYFRSITDRIVISRPRKRPPVRFVVTAGDPGASTAPT